MIRDPVKTEWRRILSRNRAVGPAETVRHAIRLMEAGKFPAWYRFKLGEYLMKRRYFREAGQLLRASVTQEKREPLIDSLYSKWLWSNNRRTAAIRFLSKSVERLPHSYSCNLLSTMYALAGDTQRAVHYLRAAARLADEELTKSNRN